VVVTFLSILELAKERLVEIVQEESKAPDARLPRVEGAGWPAPIYVKSLAASDGGAANDPEAYELPEPTSDEHGSPAAGE
jgi:segregation and condensation protein A